MRDVPFRRESAGGNKEPGGDQLRESKELERTNGEIGLQHKRTQQRKDLNGHSDKKYK